MHFPPNIHASIWILYVYAKIPAYLWSNCIWMQHHSFLSLPFSISWQVQRQMASAAKICVHCWSCYSVEFLPISIVSILSFLVSHKDRGGAWIGCQLLEQSDWYLLHLLSFSKWLLSKVFKHISSSFSTIGQCRLKFLANWPTWTQDCINLYPWILTTVVELLLQYVIPCRLSEIVADKNAMHILPNWLPDSVDEIIGYVAKSKGFGVLQPHLLLCLRRVTRPPSESNWLQ